MPYANTPTDSRGVDVDVDQSELATEPDQPIRPNLMPTDVMRGLREVEEGKIFDLETVRYPGMPIGADHPPFQVMTYRSPQGTKVDSSPAWINDDNRAQQAFITEMTMGTAHTGTHIDALGHFVRGPRQESYGGVSAIETLSDFGPRANDATRLAPIVTRGVLLDIPRLLGLERLPKSYPVTEENCRAALDKQAIDIRPGDVVLVRTGYMSGWPDEQQMAASDQAGVDLSAAQFLVDQGAVVCGADTPRFEHTPSTVPGSHRPVHEFLLIDAGVPIIEYVYLEELAAEAIYSFAFIATPLKVRGATGSMIRPLAIK